MKKNIFKFLGLLVMIFSLVLGLTSCNQDDSSSQSNPDSGTVDPIVPPKPEREEHTIEELKSLCPTDGEVSEERYYVRATVKSIDNPNFGQMTIEDETGTLDVYGTYSADGTVRYPELEEKPVAGDKVLLYGNLKLYNDEAEIYSGWIIEFEHIDVPFDDSKYVEMDINSIRALEKGKLVKTTGVVARITFANGKKPSGFYLVDDTNSIYVYDSQLAAQVKIGNTVSLAGTKDYWINADEQTSADKFGYKGCNQISSCHLIDLDKSVKDFPKAWIKTSSVKEILDNDPKNDITSTIFKVNGLVEKKVNPGFTNYYIFDIDGKTGSYVYTQCSGADFDWLDEFDGKICTIYLSAMNGKATSAGITYRFLPVAVSYDNYKFDLSLASQYALDYEILPLFGNDYMLDPALELPSKVSNSNLGIKDVAIEYSSADLDSVYFEVAGDKVLMHTKNTKDAETLITIKASLNGIVKEATLTIKTLLTPDIKYTDIKTAIDSTLETEVIVRGIVGASLVNQDGFYLIDKTGVIAVKTTTEVLGKLKLGNEIIIKGTITLWGKKDKTPYELCIKDGDLLLNAYGKHEYSTDSFISGKNLKDITSLDMTNVKQTASAYIVENCEVEVTETAYYTSIALLCNGEKINLYSSSANQYKWLKEFAGEKITVHIAPCNWNSKGIYSGCVLAVVKADGTRIVNNLNFNK